MTKHILSAIAFCFLMVFIIFFYVWVMNVIDHNERISHVLSDSHKQVLFTKIAARGFFVGKDGKRPALCVRDDKGKLHLLTEEGWVKL